MGGVLEAMACGALVASEGMPVEEVITNGVEGVLVPMDNLIVCQVCVFSIER